MLILSCFPHVAIHFAKLRGIYLFPKNVGKVFLKLLIFVKASAVTIPAMVSFTAVAASLDPNCVTWLVPHDPIASRWSDEAAGWLSASGGK